MGPVNARAAQRSKLLVMPTRFNASSTYLRTSQRGTAVPWGIRDGGAQRRQGQPCAGISTWVSPDVAVTAAAMTLEQMRSANLRPS